MLRQIQNLALDASERNDTLRTLAIDYQATSSVVREDTIESQWEGFTDFSSWVIDNLTTLTLTTLQAEKYVLEGGGRPQTTGTEEFDGFASALWASLASEVIVNGYSERAEFLLEQVRTMEILIFHASATTDQQLLDYAARKIELPPRVTFTQESEAESTVPNDPNDAVDTASTQAYTEIGNIESAIAEITLAYEKKVEERRKSPADYINQDSTESGTSTNARRTSAELGFNFLTPGVDATLSEPTLIEVDNVGMDRTGFDALKVIEMMTEAIQVKSRTAYQREIENQRFARIGNTLLPLPSRYASVERTADPFATVPKTVGKVQPIGVGDLKVVRKSLLCYEPGEIAHIENVLAGESRNRETRHLHRTEETLITDQEEIKETQRDLQTTERFEIETEVSSVVQNQSQTSFGYNLSASYGPVVFGTNGNFGSTNSQSTSDFTASAYAAETLESVRQRIIQRNRTQRISTKIEEFEEINQHGIDNSASMTDHVVGIYRWVDKVYEAQVYNYGRRLMFEFIVPEPAALYIYMQARDLPGELLMTEPQAPDQVTGNLGPLRSADDINPQNYLAWAAKYGAKGVKAPPRAFQVISKAFHQPHGAQLIHAGSFEDIELPDGYVAVNASVKGRVDWAEGSNIEVYVGKQSFSNKVNGTAATNWPNSTNGQTHTEPLSYETGSIPVSYYARETTCFSVNIEIVCRRSAWLVEQWKIATYDAIIEAYKAQKQAFEAAVAKAQTGSGITIQGQNPKANRQIEREELKRACLSLFTGQKFEVFDAMRHPYPDMPDFKEEEALAEGAYIQFFEQAFEWEQLVYQFYPYFWSRKDTWKDRMNYKDNDPLFQEFLKSGAARVLVPVRPAYDDAVLYYLSSGGVIWNGGDVPQVNDPLYVPLVAEMTSDKEYQSGQPWEVPVPTNLVILQQDASGINETGLPCNR
ncbi:MAG: hypothetical protein AAGN35_17420 [Bacteroidota bacterium]